MQSPGAGPSLVRQHISQRKAWSPCPGCYFLDAENHIASRSEIEADALEGAIAQALEILKGHPEHRSFEIWQGDQRLYCGHG